MKRVVKMECYDAVARVGFSLVFAASTRGRSIVSGKPIASGRDGLVDCSIVYIVVSSSIYNRVDTTGKGWATRFPHSR